MTQLEGKVALVTGAGSGIGRANAQVMASRGATLIVNDQHEVLAAETVALIIAAGGRAITCAADVTSANSVTSAIERARQQVGEIDILVNNAGVASGRKAFVDIDEATLDRMFAVNVKGAMFCARAVLPSMKARMGGKIINTSSIMGITAQRRGSHRTDRFSGRGGGQPRL